MKEIILSSGDKTQISDEDFDYLSQWKWCLIGKVGNQYAARTTRNKTIYIHKLIIIRMGLIISDGEETDHRDRNKLNNQRWNLRVVTRSVNQHNVDLRKDNSSGCKGVYFHSLNRMWIATIKIRRIKIHLGSFYTFEEAKAARLRAEELYLKEK